jgi:hypothetical protein
MRGLLALAFLGVVSGCASSGDAYSNRWDGLAKQHFRLIATAEGAAWEQAFLPVHNAFWRDVYASCAGQAASSGLTSFRAIAVVDKTGIVTEFLTMPNSRHLGCFSAQMVGRQYPAPPTAPFYEVFEVSLVN